MSLAASSRRTSGVQQAGFDVMISLTFIIVYLQTFCITHKHPIAEAETTPQLLRRKCTQSTLQSSAGFQSSVCSNKGLGQQ
jgi:hypothetical protein